MTSIGGDNNRVRTGATRRLPVRDQMTRVGRCVVAGAWLDDSLAEQLYPDCQRMVGQCELQGRAHEAGSKARRTDDAKSELSAKGRESRGPPGVEAADDCRARAIHGTGVPG